MRIQFLLILISDNALGLAKFMNYYSPLVVYSIAQWLNDDPASSSLYNTTKIPFQTDGPLSDWLEGLARRLGSKHFSFDRIEKQRHLFNIHWLISSM